MSKIGNLILDRFFSGEMYSFREAYVHLTGDRKVTGRMSDCDPMIFRESIGTQTLPEVLGDALNRQVLKEFSKESHFDVWRKLARVVPLKDFRHKRLVRLGGFGDLPKVGEGQPYLEGIDPVDVENSYAPEKRGRLVSITMEAIKNDDADAIRRIPKDLARVAKRTLAKFVLDMFSSNPVLSDGFPMFSVARGNLGSAALSGVSLRDGVTAIKRQKEFGTDEAAMAQAKYVLVPIDLEEQANDLLFNRGVNQDKTFLQRQGMEVVPVWYWQDPNDWALAVEPDEFAPFEIGFLDGKEEPELFVQDIPTGGSVFAKDCLTWKVRHIYGGGPVEATGVYRSIVA